MPAKEQLLVALRDGDLHAQGRYTEERPYSRSASRGGFGLHSGYHSSIDPEHWLEGIFGGGRLTGAKWQFIDIRMPRFVVLAIWPPYPEPALAEPAEALAYTTPDYELMRRAIAEFGLGAENQSKKGLLVDWFQRQQIDGEPVSGKLADATATLVRLPTSLRGGVRRPLGAEPPGSPEVAERRPGSALFRDLSGRLLCSGRPAGAAGGRAGAGFNRLAGPARCFPWRRADR